MEHQSQPAEDTIADPAHATEASSLSPTPVPRRRLFRALSGIAVGVVALVGLTSCGGEGGEEDEEDEEDDD